MNSIRAKKLKNKSFYKKRFNTLELQKRISKTRFDMKFGYKVASFKTKRKNPKNYILPLKQYSVKVSKIKNQNNL